MVNFAPLKLGFTKTVASSERVELQIPAPAHKKTFIDFVRRNKEFHEPWVYVSGDPKFFDQYLRRIKMGQLLGFFIFTKDEGEFVGVINMNSIRLDPFGSATLGYYADEKHAGKGYMKEAIRMVLDHGFNKIGLIRVEVNVQPGNEASIALVKSTGFTKEGFSRKFLKIGTEYKDHERWAMIADDF